MARRAPFSGNIWNKRSDGTILEAVKKIITKFAAATGCVTAGTNEVNGDEWVMSMGHFMGLFDEDWLGIKKTGKITNLRYAEFNCVENGKITRTGLFVDIIGFML